MDTQVLHDVLLHTFSNDQNLRKQAETAIGQIVNTESVFLEVRQAAAISMKNMVAKYWDVSEEKEGEKPAQLSDADKAVFKDNVIETLSKEKNKPVRDLIAESVSILVRLEYPALWPQLLPTAVQNIQSGDSVRMINNLLILRKLVRKYEFTRGEARNDINIIVESTFPMLQQLFASCLEMNSLEAAQMMRFILKIFWSSFQLVVPQYLRSPPVFVAWMEMFRRLLAKRLPEASEGVEPLGQPVDKDERNRWPWWKAKKWILQVFVRFFQQWGQSHLTVVDDDGLDPIRKVWCDSLVIPVLQTVMELLALRPRGQFCTDRVVQLSLNFMGPAVELGATYKLIKPHMDFLLFNVIHGVIRMKEEDLQLWQDDPHEFLRKANDFIEDFFDPTNAAIALVEHLARIRKKTVVPKLLTFYNGIMQTYNSLPVEKRDFIDKDAALCGIGYLADILQKSKIYRPSIEPMIMQNVVPEFDNPHGFMRSRAMWMFRHFSTVNYSNPEHLRVITRKVLQCLGDPDLPVQIQAAKTVRFLVGREDPEPVLEVIGPVLPQVLEHYFRLMDEIGNEEVVLALDTIIDHFGENIAPFAIQLIEKLCEAFRQFVAAGEDDAESSMAAAQALDAINTVLGAMHTKPELYRLAECHLIPVLQLILREDGEYMEYMESGLQVITFYTFYCKKASMDFWGLFPMLFNAFNEWAADYVNNLVTPIDNFITHDPEVYLSGRGVVNGKQMSYLEMVFDFVQKIMGKDSSEDGENEYEVQEEAEKAKVLWLVISTLQMCKGKVDAVVPAVLKLVVESLQKTVKRLEVVEKSSSKRAETLVKVLRRVIRRDLIAIASALWYSPPLAVSFLEQANATSLVFNVWMQQLELFNSVFSKKMTVIGLSALLQMPSAELPALVRSGLGAVLGKSIELSKALVDGDDEEGEEEDEDEEDDDEEDEDEDFNEDEGDAVDADEEEYVKALAKMEKEMTDEANFLAYLGDDDDDEEEEDEYTSALDDVDPLSFFLQSVQGAAAREPSLFHELQNHLPSNLKADYEVLVQEERRRAAKQ